MDKGGHMGSIKISRAACGLLCCLLVAPVQAQENSPWGTANPAPVVEYQPQKVVFDVAVDTPEAVDTIMDRMSGLSVEYGSDPFDASIVAVLHGPEMAFFTIDNFQQYESLVRRAQSLTVGGVIEFRMFERAEQ